MDCRRIATPPSALECPQIEVCEREGAAELGFKDGGRPGSAGKAEAQRKVCGGGGLSSVMWALRSVQRAFFLLLIPITPCTRARCPRMPPYHLQVSPSPYPHFTSRCPLTPGCPRGGCPQA